MKKVIALIVLIGIAAPVQAAQRFYFPGEKTEAQKKREARERYEERYQQKLDLLYLLDQESLVEYNREMRKLKLDQLRKSQENDPQRPALKPAEGPYLKRR